MRWHPGCRCGRLRPADRKPFMATITAPEPPTLPVASGSDPDERLFRKLNRMEARAEIVNGRIKKLGMSGFRASFASLQIMASLRERFGIYKVGSMVGPPELDYKVNLPNRRTFRPDASFYTGPDTGMEFAAGAPAFAAEVRSRDDYGLRAEREILDKRRDYFAAGTLAIWEVDLKSGDVVRVYRHGNADTPAAVTSPTPNLPCPAGPCLWTTFFRPTPNPNQLPWNTSAPPTNSPLTLPTSSSTPASPRRRR